MLPQHDMSLSTENKENCWSLLLNAMVPLKKLSTWLRWSVPLRIATLLVILLLLVGIIYLCIVHIASWSKLLYRKLDLIGPVPTAFESSCSYKCERNCHLWETTSAQSSHELSIARCSDLRVLLICERR